MTEAGNILNWSAVLLCHILFPFGRIINGKRAKLFGIFLCKCNEYMLFWRLQKGKKLNGKKFLWAVPARITAFHDYDNPQTRFGESTIVERVIAVQPGSVTTALNAE